MSARELNLLDDDGENRAVRTFLMQYSCDRSITVGAMLAHMNRSGWREVAPPFALEVRPETHLTKAGAQLWIRHLFDLEIPRPDTGSHLDSEDAARYRWLRDKSEPGICSFYLSVGQAFKGVKFARETVDEAIDAAIAATKPATEES